MMLRHANERVVDNCLKAALHDDNWQRGYTSRRTELGDSKRGGHGHACMSTHRFVRTHSD
jgi:hypothetical protein